MDLIIYVVFGPSGEYEDYYEECLGGFLNRDNAEKTGKDWYKEKTSPVLPMTWEEYEEKYNFGYAEEDYEEEGERCNLGPYSKADFERMDEAWQDRMITYYEPIIREVKILDYEGKL